MAHLYRPTYTRPIPDDAVIVKIKKQAYARWTGRGGRKFEAPVSESDPTRCIVEVDCWWIEYEDHLGRRAREKAFPDRSASEHKLHEIKTRISRIEAGELPASAHVRAGKSLPEMIDEWREHLNARDLTPKHIRINLSRVAFVIEGIGAHKPTDIENTRVNRFLKSRRESDSRPWSAVTSNHYLTAIRAFVKWLIDQNYVDTDPMSGSERIEYAHRRTFERRALTPDEITKLIDATKTNRLLRCPVLSNDRVALYLTAIYTGFRLMECASLTRQSFRLDPPSPQIDLHGAASKNRKPAHQPIPESIAAVLREWLQDKPNRCEIWPRNYLDTGGAASMLRRDLKAAGIDPDLDGKLDFHSLRVTFGTLLANSGVPIQHAQKLLRHSTPTLTARHYTKLLAGDLATQIGKLPTSFG